MQIRRAINLFKQAINAWIEDYAPSMGAALAYYTLFSIAPMLIIVIALAGLFFGAESIRGEILAQMAGLMGQDGASAVADMLERSATPQQGLIATIVSLGVLFIGATTAFAELQASMDRIWKAPAASDPEGIWRLVRSRLLSFGMIMGIAFLLMVSLVITAGLAVVGKWWGPWFGAGWEALAHMLNFIVSFGLITVLFALIYKIIPRVHIRWKDVWVGAAVTSLLFGLGKFAIGLYLGKSDITTAFGAAGSLVVLMVWVYYSAQIFLIGAEFTWLYAHEYGSRRGMDRPQTAAAVVSAPAQEAARADASPG
jgi:membrane protein